MGGCEASNERAVHLVQCGHPRTGLVPPGHKLVNHSMGWGGKELEKKEEGDSLWPAIGVRENNANSSAGL